MPGRTAISTEEMVRRIREAGARDLARAMTAVLRDDRRGRALRAALEPHLGRAHRTGVTGPPGAGKSTLIAALARRLVNRGEKVGVVAADPRSPFSGGAFLGDRVRLAGFGLAADPGVFFRSLATADGDEATARKSQQVAEVLDAAGYPWIFLETVGVGQSDVAVRERVDTVLVVLLPDVGDEVQLLKAGILEIADIYVIGRAGRPGTEKLRGLLEERVDFGSRKSGGWVPPVLLTEATRGDGLEELLGMLERHRRWLGESGRERERKKR